MPAHVRNLLAFLLGVVIGSVVNMALILVGPLLIPVPEGVDMSDMSKFSENLMLLKPANFVAPWLAHAIGTLAGAFVTAKIAASHQLYWAMGVGLLFLAGGIYMVATFGGPIWFAVVDLVGAYVPESLLGAKLAAGRRSNSFATSA